MRAILFLLLLSTVNAKYVTIDSIASSHTVDKTTGSDLYPGDGGYDAANADGCRTQIADGTCPEGPCDCPTGSACIPKNPFVTGSVDTCRTLTTSVYQGTSGYDYEASNVIYSPTQVPWLTAFSTEKVDAEGSADGAGSEDKYHSYKIQLNDVNELLYTGCEVSLSGSLVDATAASGPELQDVAVFDNSQTSTVTCVFRPLNKGYLGIVNVNITFTKDPVYMGIGEKEIESIEMHVRYSPDQSDDEWHNPLHSQWETGSFKAILFPDHDRNVASDARYDTALTNKVAADTAVFRFNQFNDGSADVGYDNTLASALKGTVQLPVKGTFFDGRYKIAEQSGVEALLDKIGDGVMRKEGMDIHYDFKDFYDASKNSFKNANIDMNPVALFTDYIQDADLDTSLQEHAQYVMEHVYTFTYGGYDNSELSHFQKDYLSCPLCEARIVFKAFRKTGAYDATQGGSGSDLDDFVMRYHTDINIDHLPTSTNTVFLDDIDVTAVAVADGHSGQGALRLPTEDDPQNPNGHALGEFFTVVKAPTKIEYNSLIDTFELLGTRLVVTGGAGSADITTTATQGCDAGAGPLYQLGNDIVAKAQIIFDRDCRIVIPKVDFGTVTTLDYTNALAATTSSTIYETDLRQIFSGNTELSLLRRKADTQAINTGSQVTFEISKVGVTGALSFTIKGSNTMLGYGSDGRECTEADVTAGDAGCKGVLEAGENQVTTDALDNVATTVTVRSSPDCFLYMDVELHDNSATFAVYPLRLPCVRTTDQVGDQLNLTYAFTSGYSLSKDVVSAEIDYELPTDMLLSVFDYGFGSCAKNASNYDVLVKPTTCVDDGTHLPVTGWVDDGTSKITLDAADDITLLTLKTCDDSSDGIADTEDNYQIVHFLGMVYRRDYLEGGRTKSRTYCQDQKFVTSLRRDAQATVTVATLVSPTLERSVMVTELNWIGCSSELEVCKGSSDCYKLSVALDSRERDSFSDLWTDSVLKDVFEPTSGGVNSDSMTVVHSLSAGSTGHVWSLESQCGPVYSCTDGAGTHFGDLTSGTEQDIVLRGRFEGVDVDTDVKVKTKFSECPLESATTDLGGELLVGMELTCQAPDGSGGWNTTVDVGGSGARSTVDSAVSEDVAGTETPKQNCASALASAKAIVFSDIYLDGRNSTGLANAVEWSFRDIDYKINRYEADLYGNKDPSKQISSDLMMEIRYNSANANYDCEQKKSGLTGLPTSFDSNILKCAAIAITAEQAKTLEFDLLPLQDANMDIFEVEMIAVLRNDNLEQRRLRRTYTINNLKASSTVDESSGGFQVMPATKEISDYTESDDNATKEEKKIHDHLHEMNDLAIIGIIVGVIIIAIIGCLYMYKDERHEEIADAVNKKMMSGISVEENEQLIDDGFTPRYKNLRY